ncbi:hypothetical protein GGR58DRAFT_504073 [Xylaria digitata]|nr:hypothetical protein GGR58DRAFT_504073 [Xylaria digitata]
MDTNDPFGWSFSSGTPRPDVFHIQPNGNTDSFQAMNSTQEQNIVQQGETGVTQHTGYPTSVMAPPQQPSNDVVMLDFNFTGPSDPGPSSRGQQARKRARYARLDWNAHKTEIRKLYLDQNHTLKETMEIMANTHSFNASEKLYKKKFKEWDWVKNLPVELAIFMTQKARERRQEENKDTVFIYGGRHFDHKRAEDTISRAKRSETNQVPINAETPQGVSYKTPAALTLSPGNDNPEEEEEDWDTSSESTDIDVTIQLSWQGNTGNDFLNVWRSALVISKQNRKAEAEELLKQAVDGLCHVSGATHEDTKKASFDLANLYAETGREVEAMQVAEGVIKDHVKILGIQNRKTQQTVLQAIELLNAWNRHTEALGLLARAQEILDSLSSNARLRERNPKRGGGHKGKGVDKRRPKTSSDHLSDVIQHINERPDPANIDYGLGVARNHVASRDKNAERLLLATIGQCESHPEGLAKQHIIAWGELIKLYQKLGSAGNHANKIAKAMETYKRLWSSFVWDEDKFERFEFMEAVLQLAANLLSSEYLQEARNMFYEAIEKATTLFGNSDERTVWVCITIGIIYQTRFNWDRAAEWFEGAYARALASREWGPEDGIVRSLKAAFDKKHFSYLSDEGRPYKTVFGVSGIKIIPGRLHLE